eukprot:CAMPEP_0117454892 /NCGR_PEP_ID=MMETSP0759-20121206/11056_1 /TAXON_ID=63605 /ORGANISM="Percolomonas cosmopolitus, Strain WS" /LENGTH=327 /DNA_ID=CAMNT_0005248135 /DNA_START=53 /DNA_END=1034 /DNA_ORIENTATION=+
MNPTSFLLISFLFHLIYLYSIFDIRFKSPLVHSEKSFSFRDTFESSRDEYDGSGAAKNDLGLHQIDDSFNMAARNLDPPSDRLVFIVSDGMKAHSFFESHLPFLSSLPSQTLFPASWGISHTRVPTESAHVAMIAGFYEDVSAVTTGWQENPVDFDSVFRQSTNTIQIGSPDVVRIFKGANIREYSYDASMEDFASSGQELDEWVFQKLEEFLNEDNQDQDAIRFRQNLRKPGSILFLHLLGVDTAGHAFRPGTERYTQALKFVDAGVKKVYDRMEAFFGHDNRTSYIFTADHGMTSRGSHGDGDPECTRTPFVVWGAGVRHQGDGD